MNKQLVFMVGLVLVGTLGSVTVTPFCGVAVYHLFAVLRPHYLWKWSLPPDVSWSFYVAIAAIAGTAMQLLGMLGRPAEDERDPSTRRFYPAHICFTLFFLWLGVTYLTAQTRDAVTADGRTLAEIMTDYVKYFLMFWVTALVARSARQVWILYVLTGLAIGYIAYEVNFLYLTSGYLGVGKDGYGGYDNNGAGLFFALGLPICFFLWEGMQRWWRWLFLALVPCLLHAVLMSYSRGAMLSLLIATPLFFFRSRRKLPFAIAGLALALLVPILAGQQIRERFSTISEYERDDSANSRFASWSAAFRIARDHPVFGVGVRNSPLLSHLYGADQEGRVIHNQYLQVAADNGFIGIGLYLALIVTSWRGVRQAQRRLAGRDDAEARQVCAMAAGLEGALAIFCVAALFLSLEAFEVQYLLFLLAAQLPIVAARLEARAVPVSESAALTPVLV